MVNDKNMSTIDRNSKIHGINTENEEKKRQDTKEQDKKTKQNKRDADSAVTRKTLKTKTKTT